MSNKYAGTQTEKNLMAAFSGESEARNKYTYFASKAKKDGYVQIAAIFEETAKNEKEHAKLWFKLLHGGKVPTTTQNLSDAADGENFEWTDMYKKFAEEASKAGLKNLKGHRSVGGMRASIYNAMPYEGVEKLVEFMKKFAAENPKLDA